MALDRAGGLRWLSGLDCEGGAAVVVIGVGGLRRGPALQKRKLVQFFGLVKKKGDFPEDFFCIFHERGGLQQESIFLLSLCYSLEDF